jgi:hypothetical protein
MGRIDCSIPVVVILWNMLEDEIAAMDGPPILAHLLWALMWMKTYAKESTLSSAAGVDEKTFRKWMHFFVDAISNLEYKVVS